MSIYTITIDKFMQLSRPTLEFALRLFEQEINGTIDFIKTEPDARNDEETLDKLSHLLSLRKVFRLRLEELATEAAKASETDSSIALLPNGQLTELAPAA